MKASRGNSLRRCVQQETLHPARKMPKSLADTTNAVSDAEKPRWGGKIVVNAQNVNLVALGVITRAEDDFCVKPEHRVVHLLDNFECFCTLITVPHVSCDGYSSCVSRLCNPPSTFNVFLPSSPAHDATVAAPSFSSYSSAGRFSSFFSSSTLARRIRSAATAAFTSATSSFGSSEYMYRVIGAKQCAWCFPPGAGFDHDDLAM